ncbi:gamma-glutamyl-gamma-aminobutyrate hydrolase family protein [Alicyclobacillus kakegawensis]|uniref:gamma-glutamyl-gamma-aminobutyrate hydrolase family protein n=1 Tax=Alicyclobacillus kakegawensis TaxID=392012 RepID=UPI00082A6621|nr:gamma-glutamyl-gamma-aminobutyrate hydrolase family protein [Alicyclobacillus kakegawensis]
MPSFRGSFSSHTGWRPLIGITGSRHQIAVRVGAPLPALVSADDYACAVEAAGGLPLVVPYVRDGDTVLRLAQRMDGLLLAGGEDPDPALYGEAPQRGLGAVVPERDLLELRLLAAMVGAGKPVLGICRGVQVLVVAFGGTLYQDLGRHWPGRTQHMQHAPRAHRSHKILIDPYSRLYRLLGRRASVWTNSFHHQAVKDVGLGLRAVAWDEEGLIEAVEHPGAPFLLGVQWHPENLWREQPEFFALFQGLVEAAQRGGSTTERRSD